MTGMKYIKFNKLFFSLAQNPNSGQDPIILQLFRSHKMTYHSRQDLPRRGIGPSQRPLPDNTQHSQETESHALCGIRIRSHSKRAAADPRLRPFGHCHRFSTVTAKQTLLESKNFTHPLPWVQIS